MRESEVEKHLIHCAERIGGSVRKVKWIGRRSAPDRLVLIPDGDVSGGRFPKGVVVKRPFGYSFFVELKRPGEKATAAQSREHNRMRKCGIEVYVASTFEEVERLFK